MLLLVERIERLDDIESLDHAMARLGAGEETFPADVARRLPAAESPVRVFREYRKLSQHDLAYTAGISVPAISKLEPSGNGALVDNLFEHYRRISLAPKSLALSL